MKQAAHILITGGARSGKSRFAEDLAGQIGGRVIYLATAEPFDAEMVERIAVHRRRRPAEWLTVEEPLDLAAVIRGFGAGDTVLVDCLTVFLSNLIFKRYMDCPLANLEPHIHRDLLELENAVNCSAANILLVTNEVGGGIVPKNELARTFRDLAGIVNQAMAAVCNQVYMVVAGIPVKIKG